MLVFFLKTEEELTKFVKKKLKEPENIKKKENQVPELRNPPSIQNFEELLRKCEQIKKVFSQ